MVNEESQLCLLLEWSTSNFEYTCKQLNKNEPLKRLCTKKRCQNEIIGPEQIRTTTVNIKTLISTISTFLAQIKKFIKCLVCSVWMFKLIWRPKIISIPRIFWSKSDLSQLSSTEVKVYGILNLEGSWTNLETKFIYNCYEHSSSISFWIWKFEEI